MLSKLIGRDPRVRTRLHMLELVAEFAAEKLHISKGPALEFEELELMNRYLCLALLFQFYPIQMFQDMPI
jgi:hypothetical protein